MVWMGHPISKPHRPKLIICWTQIQAHELVGYLAQVQTHSLAQVLVLQRNFFFFFWQRKRNRRKRTHTERAERRLSYLELGEPQSHQIVVVKIAKQLFCVRSCASLCLEIGQQFLSPNSIWNIKKHYLLANRQYQVVVSFSFFSICNFRYPDGETCRWSRIHWFHQLQ